MDTPVLVITGPSGVGKGTLIRALLERVPGSELSVSATTRAPRPGEVNGRDYHFLAEVEFLERVRAGEFVEHAEYAGNHYGTLRSELQRPASLIVLETQADYERFDIRKSQDSLGNASMTASGAVPEPEEWALIILAVLAVTVLTLKPYLLR